MFGAVLKVARNLTKIDKNKMIGDILAIPSIQSQIIDLNQSQLYDQGVDAAGDPTGDYSHATIYGTTNFEGKIEKGQPYDHVTGKDSGASYDSMKIVLQKDSFAIMANFPEGFMQGWPDALGLTQESKEEIIPEIRERLVDALLKKALK